MYCTTIRGGVHLIDSRVDLTPQRTISELNNINGTYMAIRPDQDQFFVTHSENVPLYQIDKREFRVMKRTRLYRNTSCTSLHLAKNHLLINVKSGDVYYYNLQKQMMEYKWQPNKGKEVPGLVHVVNAHESDGVVFYMTAYELSAYMPGRKGTLYDNLESKNVFINVSTFINIDSNIICILLLLFFRWITTTVIWLRRPVMEESVSGQGNI